MQLAASGMGGYLAGRLRTRWAGAQPDEVYFRDTAHGFLAWAVATLGTAALLTSVIGAIIGGGIQAGAAVAGNAASAAVGAVAVAADRTAEPGATGRTDDLLRGLAVSRGRPRSGARPRAAGANCCVYSLKSRVFSRTASGQARCPMTDVRYVGQVVARRTDLSQQQAEQRVRDVFGRLQTTLNEAEAAARQSGRRSARSISVRGVVALHFAADRRVHRELDGHLRRSAARSLTNSRRQSCVPCCYCSLACQFRS